MPAYIPAAKDPQGKQLYIELAGQNEFYCAVEREPGRKERICPNCAFTAISTAGNAINAADRFSVGWQEFCMVLQGYARK